jgi:hypothetical protein
MTRLALCLSLAALTGALQAQEKPPQPPRVLPLANGNARVDGDNLLCRVRTMRYVPETRTVQVVENGQLVTKTQTVLVPVTEERMHMVPLKDTQAFKTGPKGADPTKALQKLDADVLRQALGKEQKVLVALDGKKVEPADVRTAQEGTVVLVLPKEKPAPPK